MPTIRAVPKGNDRTEGGEVHKPGTVCDALRDVQGEIAMETRHEPCKLCGSDIEYTWRSEYPVLKPTVCDPCYEKIQRDRKAKRSGATLPFDEWDFKRGNNVLLKHILNTSLGSTKPEEGRWPNSLFIHGRTGLCKTRAVCEAARRFTEVGGEVSYLSAHKGMSRYSELLGQSMAEAGRYQNRIASFRGLLLLDDLGVGSITERSLEFLFAIADGRLADNLPTWITSNYDYTRLQKWIGRSDAEYAERIVRRIADLAVVVNAEEVK